MQYTSTPPVPVIQPIKHSIFNIAGGARLLDTEYWDSGYMDTVYWNTMGNRIIEVKDTRYWDILTGSPIKFRLIGKAREWVEK